MHKISRCFLLLILFGFSCSTAEHVENRIIFLDSLTEKKIDTGSGYFMEILATFPSSDTTAFDKTKYTLFLCKDSIGDSIYVFDNAKFTGVPFKNIVVSSDSVTTNPPQKITLSLPKRFILSRKTKYIFTELTWAID